MKTVITQKIDGYDIVVGIGEPQIDPVATIPIVDEKLKDTEIFKQCDTLIKSFSGIMKAISESYANAKKAVIKSEKTKYTAEYQAKLEEYENVQAELKKLQPELIEKRKELIYENAVYFIPKSGEFIITDEKADEFMVIMQTATEQNNFVDVNMNIIEDYTGLRYYKKSSGKWSFRDIVKIGDSPTSGEIASNDLTDSQIAEISVQFESERISKMTGAEKKAEKEARIASLTAQAAQKKSEMEVQGDKKALEIAQEWLATEIAKIEDLYK